MPVEFVTATIGARVIQNKELDGNYDFETQAIIGNSDPSCSLFTEDSNCEDLVEIGLPTNLMSTIASFESMMLTKKQDFKNADKTSSSALLPVFVF